MRTRTLTQAAPAVLLCLLLAGSAHAVEKQPDRQPKDAAKERPAKPEEDLGADRLLQKAEELLQGGETERGLKMLETLLKQYPASELRFAIRLSLGRHYMKANEYAKAIENLRELKDMAAGEEPLTGQPLEIYLEGQYLTGVAYFHLQQYAASFPILRNITRAYPNTVWANQSYYYIGMCHFAQQNWSKAIEALSFVGTFVDPNSPTVKYVEAGRRFYVKISDGDLLIAYRMGEQISLEVSTANGDKETIQCIPLLDNEGVYIGSIATEVGVAKPGDGTLQIIGGDTIKTRYIDKAVKDGQRNVPREVATKVVSTATLNFTLGTYDSSVAAAFIGQPLFLLLTDVDGDVSPQADTMKVRVISRFKRDLDAASAEGDDQDLYQTRDEVTVTLKELGQEPVHSGRFAGTLRVEAARADAPADKGDDVLQVELGDEVVASYVDELHAEGEVSRVATTSTKVIGELDSSPRASQDVVSDPVLRAKKNQVEALAYLELARIFKSMGLLKGAKEKAEEGLARVDTVLRGVGSVPEAMKEQCYKTKWELYLAADDFNRAIATCQTFNRLYPDSPLVDEALMGIGNIYFESKDYKAASRIFQSVLRMPKSRAKAEAQYRIAECAEAEGGNQEAAVRQYRICAQQYPDSKFAGESLSKVVDYYVTTKDYAQANDLLAQVFQDYPDGAFLDRMLLKWVMVAYYRGEYATAYEKCKQLIFDYPSSQYAETAKQLIEKIKPRLGQGQE